MVIWFQVRPEMCACFIYVIADMLFFDSSVNSCIYLRPAQYFPLYTVIVQSIL